MNAKLKLKNNANTNRRTCNVFVSNAEKLHKEHSAYKRLARFELMIWIVFVVTLAMCVRVFVFEPVRVDGDSMVSTLFHGERMLVEKVSYWFSRPKRGDIVICHYPQETFNCVKRVIAVEGDVIEIKDGRIFLNDSIIDESSYWDGTIYNDFPRTVIEKGRVFVVGDNRNYSKDSRYSAVGQLKYGAILGRVTHVFGSEKGMREVS